MNITFGKLILIITLISSHSKYFSQDLKNSETPLKKNAISLSVLGVTPLIGFSYGRILSEKISAEIGVGFISLGAGIKYYPWGMKTNKLLFHTGIAAAASEFHKKPMIDGEGFVSYIPFGVNYFGIRSLNIGANIGPGTSYFNFENVLIYGNLNIGFRF